MKSTRNNFIKLNCRGVLGIITFTIIYILDFGFYKLDVKTTTDQGIEFKTSGSNNHDSGKVNANLETKYKWKDYGMLSM